MSEIQARKALVGATLLSGLGLLIAASSPLDWVLSGSLIAMSEAQRRKDKYEYQECVGGLLDWGTESIHYAGTNLSAQLGVEHQAHKLISAAVDQLPFGDAIAGLFAKKNLPDEFINSIERKATLIAGESGDGKTFLLHWRVQRFMQAHPDGEIIICDPDYGSGHGDQKNDWFGLPLDKVIITEPDAIHDAVLLVAAKLDQRVEQAKQGVKHSPLLLVIDEWTTLVGDWSSTQLEAILTKLRKINRKGLKQNVFCTIGTHSLAVSEASMPKGFLRDWQALFLWSAAQQADNYRNLGIPAYRIDEAVEQISGMPQTVGGKRSAIAYVDKSLQLVGIPQLKLSDERVTSPTDEAQLWLEEVRPRLEAELSATGKLTYTRAWELAEGNARDRRKDNPRYLAIRSLVDSLKNSEQK